MALRLVVHLIPPVANSGRALRRTSIEAWENSWKSVRVEITGTGADTGIVRANCAAHVVGVILLPVDVPDHVAAGVDQAKQIANLAVQRPGRALVPILAVTGCKSV